MRYIVLFLALCSVAHSQLSVPTGAEMWETTIAFEAVDDDSAHVLTLPTGAAITRGWLIEDSVGTGEVGTLHIGIQGESSTITGRFYSGASVTITEGRVTELTISDESVGYVTDNTRQVWVYSSIPSGQIRIMIEYRKLR